MIRCTERVRWHIMKGQFSKEHGRTANASNRKASFPMLTGSKSRVKAFTACRSPL
jgi:hypothetical protein